MVANAPVQTDPEGKVDENSIPKSRVDAMIAKAKADAEARATAAEARAEMEKERRRDLESRSQPSVTPNPPAPRPLSREELRLAVDEGKISQDQMDAELERQVEMRVEQRVASTQEAKDRAVQINTEIDQYMERVSDLDDPTSDNHKRVRDEFKALRKRGYANDATTELVALRAVLGDITKVKIPEEGPGAREVDPTTHGGSGGEKADAESRGPGPLKGLKPEFVEYYTEGIKAGRYRGWDDPHLVKIMTREVKRK